MLDRRRFFTLSELVLFFDQAESFVRCAQLRSVFIEDNGYGNIFEKILEVPFILKRIEERAVLHFFENLNGNAAGNVDATKSKNLQSKITRLRAVDVGPEIDRVDADGASFVQTILRDFRSGVGVGVSEGSVLNRRIEKFVEGTETAAGKNQLPTDLWIAATHKTEKLDLLFSVRREIGVAAFGSADAVARAVPDEKSLAE